jgi:mycothiol synthase
LVCIQVEQDTFGLGNGDGHDVTATDDKENIKKRVSVEFEGQLRRLVSRVVKIRRFVQGTDEADWLRVWNVVYGTCLDLAPMTVEEITAISKSPDFDSEGRFIVELDDQPVGIVHACVDKFMEEKKGFVRDFGVVPEFRGRGIEEKLAETALAELKNRGMKVAQSSAYGDQRDIVRLWERLGFRLVRRLSLMTKELVGLQSDTGENTEVVLKPLRRYSDKDLEILNRLENECFKELFDWRRSPLERTVYLVREDPFCKVQEWFFAILNGKCAGYVGMGIDESYNVKRNAKCGWVLGIGVLKPYRKMQIGTKLMLHGMARLKAKGMAVVMLGVDDQNVAKARRLYEKIGFKVARKEMVYEKTIAPKNKTSADVTINIQ